MRHIPTFDTAQIGQAIEELTPQEIDERNKASIVYIEVEIPTYLGSYLPRTILGHEIECTKRKNDPLREFPGYEYTSTAGIFDKKTKMEVWLYEFSSEGDAYLASVQAPKNLSEGYEEMESFETKAYQLKLYLKKSSSFRCNLLAVTAESSQNLLLLAQYTTSCSVKEEVIEKKLEELIHNFTYIMQAVLWSLSEGPQVKTVRVPIDYPTIQAAIDASRDGDTIIVSPGTYLEKLDFTGKNIVVRSENPDDPAIVERTIISANGDGTVVKFTSGETEGACLNGFTIKDGSASRGGGIWIDNESSPTIKNNVLRNNKATNSGGGIYIDDNSAPTIQNNTITGNEAQWGGGIYITRESAPVVEGNEIKENKASKSDEGKENYQEVYFEVKTEFEETEPKKVKPEVKGLADTPWPMRGYDPRHTGRSPYLGVQTPTEKWEFLIGNPIRSSPAIASDGTIYVGSRDNKLYAINPDGTKKWEFWAGNDTNSSPAIGADGTIYVSAINNRLYAINPDGTKKWEFVTGDEIYSSPAIGADGTIYVGSDDGKLYAVGEE